MARCNLLRLSALRALLGRVPPSVRLAKIRKQGNVIQITFLTGEEPTEYDRELLSEVATEVISDFPDLCIEEILRKHEGALPREDIIDEGWIYAEFGG